MKTRRVYSAVVSAALLSNGSVLASRRSVIVPMATERNPQYRTNVYEPEYVNRPFVMVRLLDPASGRSLVWNQSWLDTAADHCHVSDRIVDTLGLKKSAEPPVTIHTPAGKLRMHAIEAEYELLDATGRRVGDLPRMKTHFYVNAGPDPPYDVVLGQTGFLERFSSVTLRYKAREIELTW